MRSAFAVLRDCCAEFTLDWRELIEERWELVHFESPEAGETLNTKPAMAMNTIKARFMDFPSLVVANATQPKTNTLTV